MSKPLPLTTEDNRILPVLQEYLELTIRKNVTGVVRLEKTVHQTDTQIEQNLMSDILSVEHVAINTPIEEPAAMRQEGNVTIIPVMEEILVTRKQLILKEEIRITRQVNQVMYRESIPLRSERVQVERRPFLSNQPLVSSPDGN